MHIAHKKGQKLVNLNIWLQLTDSLTSAPIISVPEVERVQKYSTQVKVPLHY